MLDSGLPASDQSVGIVETGMTRPKSNIDMRERSGYYSATSAALMGDKRIVKIANENEKENEMKKLRKECHGWPAETINEHEVITNAVCHGEVNGDRCPNTAQYKCPNCDSVYCSVHISMTTHSNATQTTQLSDLWKT